MLNFRALISRSMLPSPRFLPPKFSVEASAAQEVTAHPGEINGLLTKLSEEPRGASKKTGRN